MHTNRFILVIVGMAGYLQASFASENYAVLRGSDLKLVFHQCSRPAPEPDSLYAVPRVLAQKTYEAALRMQRDDRHPFLTDDFGGYFIQLAGFEIANHKYVYVHAIRKSEGFRPSERYIEVCDGGRQASWGAMYDPLLNTFTRFWFNGPKVLGE